MLDSFKGQIILEPFEASSITNDEIAACLNMENVEEV